ncbi:MULTISPECIES: hypothetical protein [Peribacillus]|uniref:hypothetical protein n=1 Tax=Peribacillus TaxID=2675229 RepID=UPI0024E1EF9E|nr:hypothetical protein [Peribacillus simplex]MDF9763332.1 putative Na+-dependent transporter [Peribacillus simplex]
MAGKFLKWEKEEIITVTYTGGMGNIAAGAALAVAYFPAAVGFPSFSVPCFNKYWLPCMVHS